MRLRSSLFLFYEVNKMNKLVRNSEQLDLFNLPVLDEIIESKQEEKVLSIDPKKINKNADLFIKFKQIALAVYNSKEWTEDEILEAAETIYPYIGFRTNKYTASNHVVRASWVSEKSQKDLGLLGKSSQTYCHPIYFKMARPEYYKRFLILSDADSLKAHYTDTYYRKDKPFVRYTYMSEEYLVGYAYLINLLRKPIVEDSKNRMDFATYEFDDLIKGLIAGNKSNNYNFYDYAMTHAEIKKKRTKEAEYDNQLLQETFVHLGRDGSNLSYDGYLDFTRLIAYIQKALDDNFQLVA